MSGFFWFPADVAQHSARVSFSGTATAGFSASVIAAAAVSWTSAGTLTSTATVVGVASVTFSSVGSVQFEGRIIASAAVAFGGAATFLHTITPLRFYGLAGIPHVLIPEAA